MRILIVEDDHDIAVNLCDFLESRSHTVDAAADGVTGLHLAVTHDFDAILHEQRVDEFRTLMLFGAATMAYL